MRKLQAIHNAREVAGTSHWGVFDSITAVYQEYIGMLRTAYLMVDVSQVVGMQPVLVGKSWHHGGKDLAGAFEGVGRSRVRARYWLPQRIRVVSDDGRP